MALEYVNLAKGPRGWPRARTKLDGRFYSIEAIWNEGESRWGVNLYDASGVLMRAGLVVRHGEDMLAPYGGAEFPGDGFGRMKAWDSTGQGNDPGRDDLARESPVRLVYSPRADVEADSG